MKRKVTVPLISINYVEIEIDDTFLNDVNEWNYDQIRYVSDEAFEKNYNSTGNSNYEIDENYDHWEIIEE